MGVGSGGVGVASDLQGPPCLYQVPQNEPHTIPTRAQHSTLRASGGASGPGPLPGGATPPSLKPFSSLLLPLYSEIS